MELEKKTLKINSFAENSSKTTNLLVSFVDWLGLSPFDLFRAKVAEKGNRIFSFGKEWKGIANGLEELMSTYRSNSIYFCSRFNLKFKNNLVRPKFNYLPNAHLARTHWNAN